jgi:hypothetical protein
MTLVHRNLLSLCLRKFHFINSNIIMVIKSMKDYLSVKWMHYQIIKYCTRPPVCSIIDFNVHICIDPNFTDHTRIDRIYYVTDLMPHDLSAAQIIYVTGVIDFFQTLLMSILESTVNHKVYYVNCWKLSYKFNHKNYCFNFQVYQR